MMDPADGTLDPVAELTKIRDYTAIAMQQIAEGAMKKVQDLSTAEEINQLRESTANKMRELGEATNEQMKLVSESTSEKWKEFSDTTGPKVKEITESTAQSMREWTDRTAESLKKFSEDSGITQRMRGLTETTSQKVKEMSESTGLTSTLNTVGENTSQLAATASQEVNKLTNNFFSFVGSYFPSLNANNWTPTTDIRETTDAFVMEVELPGLKRDEFEVVLENKTISVMGTKKEVVQQLPSDAKFIQKERKEGRFIRSFTFPDSTVVSWTSLLETYSDGLLTLTLMKIPPVKTDEPQSDSSLALRPE